MVLSMTGFGLAKLVLPGKTIVVETKSLNGKFLDINIKIPSVYSDKELAVRKLIGKYLVRGKIDFKIYLDADTQQLNSKINKELVRNYMAQLREMQPESSEFELFKMSLTFPNVFDPDRGQLDEREWSTIETTIEESLEKLNVFRTQEGRILEEDFTFRISNILQLLQQIKIVEPQRINCIREGILAKLKISRIEVDQDRFEQELIFYLEKLDVTEEVIRLQKHCNYFYDELQTQNSNGKKLGFIAQEIGREVNTIGSKSNYAPMQKLVVQMKGELEKIREQVLNIL